MIYALDTNIISYILRGDKDVKQRWMYEESLGNISVIPLVVYYEVKRGLLSANATTKLAAFEWICKTLKVEDLTIRDIEIASHIYSERKKQGIPIEDADLFIAAQAIARGYTLATNNTRHFERVSGLRIVNWTK